MSPQSGASRDNESMPPKTQGPLKPKPKPDAGAAPLPLAALPKSLERLLKKYPFLRRHPHPFAVHFPIVFLFSAAFFNLVYLATGVVSFETSAFHFLGAGVLSLPPAMLTGELSRRLNYPREPLRAFRMEIFYSRILLALSLIAFLWRGLDPQILRNFTWLSLCYLLIILALPVLVTIISFFGGLLTFPLNEGED
jgi:uncharacterized membrane protein